MLQSPNELYFVKWIYFEKCSGNQIGYALQIALETLGTRMGFFAVPFKFDFIASQTGFKIKA